MQPKKRIRMTDMLIYLIIGLIAGVASGMVGIGGGMIIVPLLVMTLGYSQHQAQGTTLAMMIPPVGALAVWSYYKKDPSNVNFKAALLIASTFVIGALLGSRLAVKLDPIYVKRIFAVIMVLAALKLFFSK